MTGPNPPQGPYGPPPPHGQPAPPPSGYPPAPVGKPAMMSTRKKLGVIGIAVGVVVVGIVASLIFTRKGNVAQAEVGDCVKINKASETDADVDKIDCSDREAALKVAKEDCFSGLASTDKLARADCAGAEFTFVKVINGTADEAACDAETFPLVYPEPPTTFCLAAQP